MMKDGVLKSFIGFSIVILIFCFILGISINFFVLEIYFFGIFLIGFYYNYSQLKVLDTKRKTNIYLYLISFLVISFLLIREYSYIHPFNTGYFIFGPKWTYSSTRTFTWWTLLFSSLIMMFPLFKKQKIGFLGVLLFFAVFFRPFFQSKFPIESSRDFYKNRKVQLNHIIKKYKMDGGKTISLHEIKQLGFENLIVNQETYYFMVCSEEWPFGLCYNENNVLPKENFEFTMKYTKLDGNWYEFDY